MCAELRSRYKTTLAVDTENEIHEFRSVQIESVRLGDDLVFKDVEASIPILAPASQRNIWGLSLFRRYNHLRIDFNREPVEVW